MVCPQAKLPGSTSVACWLVAFVNVSVLSLTSGTIAGAEAKGWLGLVAESHRATGGVMIGPELESDPHCTEIRTKPSRENRQKILLTNPTRTSPDLLIATTS